MKAHPDAGGHTGAQSVRHAVCRHQSHRLQRMPDVAQRTGRTAGRVGLFGSRVEVVTTPLVADLELTAHTGSGQLAFPLVQRIAAAEIVRTGVAAAFVDGAVVVVFPLVERTAAVGTPIGRGALSANTTDRRQALADFTADLRALLSVVDRQPFAGRAAVFTARVCRGRPGTGPAFDRLQLLAMLPLMDGEKFTPVAARLRWRRRFGRRRSRVNVEKPVVGVLFTEVALQFDVVATAVKNLQEDCQSIKKLRRSELGAEPSDKRVYIVHGRGVSWVCFGNTQPANSRPLFQLHATPVPTSELSAEY